MAKRTPGPGRIELHGWDSRNRAWYGPDELAYSLTGCRGLVAKLRELHGCWQGRLLAQAPGSPSLAFCVQLRDLGDVGLATLDLEGSPGGPVEALLIVPAQRRGRIRPELAFEFTSYLRFLDGPVSQGSEIAIHDHLERTLAETPDGVTIVISVENHFISTEANLLAAEQAERMAMSLVGCMLEKDSCAAKAQAR